MSGNEEAQGVDSLYILRVGGECASRTGQPLSPGASLGEGPSMRDAFRVTWVNMC
jgi:hypothetical protein